MAFFGNPQQSSPLGNFITLFSLTPFGDFHPGVFNNTPGFGTVAIIHQFRNHIVVFHLGTRTDFEHEAMVTIGFNNMLFPSLHLY